MVVLDAVVATEGAGFTVIISVCVPVPEAFVAVCVTVYVPAVFHTTPVAFWVVAEAGVPPGNVHDQLVGLLVELSVKLTGAPAQTVVVLAVNAALGNAIGVELVQLAFHPAPTVAQSERNSKVNDDPLDVIVPGFCVPV
jgi:hypothetical protein